MKRKTKIIAIILFIIILLSGAICFWLNARCSKENPQILFVITYTTWDGTQSYIQAVDSDGHIYEIEGEPDCTKEEIIAGIGVRDYDETGRILPGQVQRFYKKFLEVDKEAGYETLYSGGAEEEPFVAYYGVEYIEDKILLTCIWQGGCGEIILEDENASQIVDWMKKWGWDQYSNNVM